MEHFTKIVNGFAKRYILNVCQGSAYIITTARTYLKTYKSQSNKNFIWESLLENLDKSLEYFCDGIPIQ